MARKIHKQRIVFSIHSASTVCCRFGTDIVYTSHRWDKVTCKRCLRSRPKKGA